MSFIPTEILSSIFDFLDFRQLLACRAVCSLFKILVDSQPSLQYKIELAITGQEDGFHHSLCTRRTLLKSHQHSWDALQWTHDQRLSMFHGGLWELYGNVLAQNASDGRTLHLRQLPSRTRTIEEKNWTIDVSQYRIRDFGIDPAQDLLIIVEQPQEIPLGDYHIYLRALSTGEPHPLVSGSRVLAHERFWGGDRAFTIQTCGDTLAIMFHIAHVEIEVILWNWKTGQVLANIVSDDIRSMAFLSERYLMLGVVRFDGMITEASLVIVDFVAEAPERCELDAVENAFTFHFPRLAENTDTSNMQIRSDPAPIWTPDPKLAVPFFTARHNRLYVITLVVANDFLRIVLLYALGDTFLSLIKQAGGQGNKQFGWDRWGPDGSRMMVSRRAHSRTWVCYVYGTRCVSTRRQSRTRRVCLYDFNQLALKWTKQQDARMSDNNNAVEDDELEGYLTCVTAPTKLEAGEIFEEEVETRLGYRMGYWTVPGVAPTVSLEAMCSEDGLVLVEDVTLGDGDTYRILTL